MSIPGNVNTRGNVLLVTVASLLSAAAISAFPFTDLSTQKTKEGLELILIIIYRLDPAIRGLQD